LMSINDNFRH